MSATTVFVLDLSVASRYQGLAPGIESLLGGNLRGLGGRVHLGGGDSGQ